MICVVEHVAVAAKDTAALARWYCDTLGFRVVVAGQPRGSGQGPRAARHHGQQP